MKELVDEDREIEPRRAVWLQKVAASDRAGEWRADGFLSSVAALRTVCRLDPGVARGYVDLARKLEQ